MNWNTPQNKQLVRATLALETESEARAFLCDLMTEKEITEFSKRLQAAKMLLNNQLYTTIIEETGLSSTTVARVAKCVKGVSSGYRAVFAKYNHHRSVSRGKGLH